MRRAEFVDTYRTLRARRWARTRIREHLGLTTNAFSKRYTRAVAAGELRPDTPLYRSGGHNGRMGVCACCQQTKRLQGRHICSHCWGVHNRAGTLDTHPRTTTRVADFADDYATLRAQQYTRRQIAERLRMTPDAVQKAYSRAVARGLIEPDSRAYRLHVTAVTKAYQHTRWDAAA